MQTGRTRGPTRWTHVASVLALGAVLALAACGSGDSDATTATTTTTGAAPATTRAAAGSPEATDMRGQRYCEVLLVDDLEGDATAEVYNSFPLNDCPQDQWEALDPKAIATDAGVPLAVLNGPRFWLMDGVEKPGGVQDLPKEDFGGIEMYRQASVVVGSLAEAARRYSPHAVTRKAAFTFDAGQEVYELTVPDGKVYLMQTWSQQVDPTLSEADLAGLGDRLRLPEGWSYRTRVLKDDLRLDTTSAPAEVLQDDLGNSYSQLPAG